jgi:hypothetical protein
MLRRGHRLRHARRHLGSGVWEQTRANCINNSGIIIVGWAGNATRKVGVMYLSGKWIRLDHH